MGSFPNYLTRNSSSEKSDKFEINIYGLGQFITHNLDRYLDPDQVVFNEDDASSQIVNCQNIDSYGNVSKNVCKILSTKAMNGLLILK